MTHLGTPHDAYDYIEQIGDGSFGTVHKAMNKISHKLVAVKVMKKKYNSIEECAGQFEPKLLKLLPVHLNIVQMYDSFLSPTTCELAFVMEYMDGGNLYQLMRERRLHNMPFNHCELRNILHQILSAVSHIHHHQVFHRDMKPENLLLDYSTGRPIIKLADFGLARELKSLPPYTEYVSTRWYRAPEVLLRSTEYSFPVDLWAIGAIFAELITLDPLFPGESEIDQIYRICDILGSPGNKLGVGVGQKSKVTRPEKRASPGFARKKQKEEPIAVPTVPTVSTISILDGGGEWKEGVKLAYKIGFKFPNLSPKPLESVIPNATESMLDLIRHFLFFNPSERRSADAALRHKFFTETDEAETIHHIGTTNTIEPITPPDHKHDLQTKTIREITPFDLLSIPRSPYQICPDWNTEHPVSRYGRLCSAVKDDVRRSSSRAYSNMHEEVVVPTTPVDNNAWLSQSRPIYSSHEKVHPVTDRPNSSRLWNKYNYASHQRPSTPVVVEHVGHHNNAPPSFTKRYSGVISVDELDTHRRLGHHLHHHHHPNDNRPPTSSGPPVGNSTSFSLDRMPHYGNQLIKWAPPQHFATHPQPPKTPHSNPHKSYYHPLNLSQHRHHPPQPPQPPPRHHHQYHYHQPEQPDTSELTRPESRRCRSPAPFSSQLMKHKHTTTTTTSHTSNNVHHASPPIKPWTTPAAAVSTTSVNTDKVIVNNNSTNDYTPYWATHHHHQRKSDKPQSTHRNSTHRMNLWVPDNEDDDDEEEQGGAMTEQDESKNWVQVL